jgi:hypothetical protein
MSESLRTITHHSNAVPAMLNTAQVDFPTVSESKECYTEHEFISRSILSLHFPAPHVLEISMMRLVNTWKLIRR